MKAWFVTGAGTELGKTHVACALLRGWRAAGLRCAAFKPVASGVATVADSDPGRLLDALGVEATPEALDEVCPHRFAAPLAPPLAARAEGAALSGPAIVHACRERIARPGADVLLIEGAGGLLSPLTQDMTCLDLLAALQLPALFVMGDYLGAVSHALSGLEVLRQQGIPVAAVVISEGLGGVGPAPTCEMMGWFRPDLAMIAAARGEDRGWVAMLGARLLEGG